MKRKTILCSLLALACLGASTASAQASPVKIAIIKADDIRGITTNWDRFFALSKSKGIKVSAGIICNSLVGLDEDYVAWLNAYTASGNVEFWNHGWDHLRWTNDQGVVVSEFKGTGYDHQKEHFEDAQNIMKDALGVSPVAFGSPYNATDADTVRVMEENADMRLLFTYSSTGPAGKTLARMALRGESDGTAKPNFDKFKIEYLSKPDVSFTALQFHPNGFNDAAFDEYAKIIDFLIAEGWIFVLPREYTSDTPLLANPSVSTSPPTRSADLSASRGVAAQADLRFVWDTVDQGTDLESWTHSALVTAGTQETSDFGIVEIERPRILKKAEAYLSEAPRTVTADICERSEGGPHDYYSEGDYWWPNPKAPEGPYVRRDGETNPDNFIAHRKSMIRLSDIIGTLASAYLITSEEKYATHAVSHLKAWFVDEQTKMNPSLLYGQAIKGRYSGRSIGIIDTIHLTEVARGAKLLCASPSFEAKDQASVKAWFGDYLKWINTHEYGIREKQHPNNHGVCWSLQAAAFADLVGDTEQLAWIRDQFKTVYLSKMMDLDGGFPAEVKRTKPYGYSLFVIDAMAGVAQIASTAKDDLWTFELPDGRGMKKGMEFIVPYIVDKGSWPKEPDIMYWDEWPVQHPCLSFAGVKFQRADYLTTWRTLDADPKTFEVLRNLPLRHALLWTPIHGAEQ